MLVTLNGLVVGQRLVGESSCFLDVFTDKAGLIEVMAHGAKKINGKNSGSTSLFSYSKLCLSKNGAKYTINSAEPICSFHKISQSIEALSLAAYFAEIIRYCATSEENHSDLLRFTCMTFYQLQNNKHSLSLIKAIFEFRFITHIGFMPDLRACRECICYSNDVMYFIPQSGVLYCGDCYEEQTDIHEQSAFLLTPSVLHTMRYVAYSDTEKMYSFRISEDSERLFGAVAEYYLLTQLNRSFDTLDYYKNIMMNIPTE